MANINTALDFMVNVAKDDTHGYDQTRRNGPDYDCSSLVGTALHNAGFNVSPYSWTGNLKEQLLACGFKSIGVNEPRRTGDIFLTEYHHVVMCVDEDNIVHARLNELGTVTGGKSGDQTGREICVDKFYTPSYGWGYHFRYESKIEQMPIISTEVRASKYAEHFDRMCGGVYHNTTDLNVRDGAGVDHKVLTTIPKGTVVRCYGYYSLVGNRKWLYVQFTKDTIKYTGFCSSYYLER